MFNEIMYFVTSILGTIAVIYFLISNIIGKKSHPYILSDLLFLKSEVAIQKKTHKKH